MKIWKTKDEPTNANLRLLESLAASKPMGADQATDRLTTVIAVDDMLPKAVRDHFHLPSLYIGSAHYRWSQTELEAWWSRLATAIQAGLDAVEGDVGLQKGGAGSFDDRPPTRGEELKAACRAYSDHRNSSSLDELRIACTAPGLSRYFEQLVYWLGRKRPAPGRRPISSEIWIAISNIEMQADFYHHHKASYLFNDKCRAAAAQQGPAALAPAESDQPQMESPGGLSLGQRVVHHKNGVGTITNIDGSRIEADFDGRGSKRMLESFVVKADA